jgi:hypothetical protein
VVCFAAFVRQLRCGDCSCGMDYAGCRLVEVCVHFSMELLSREYLSVHTSEGGGLREADSFFYGWARELAPKSTGL